MKEVNKEPFIHLFSCSTGYYLYDVNTDSILKVTPDTYQRLEKRENIAVSYTHLTLPTN